MIRLAIDGNAAAALTGHLAQSAPLEDGAFLLLYEGAGNSRTRLTTAEIVLPPPGGWEEQGRDRLRPSAQWLSAVIGRAIEARAGLLFVHSHPDSAYPPGLSPCDDESFTALARDIAPMLDGPFAAAVVHPQGWSGVLWSDDAPVAIDRIVSIGRTLHFLSPLPAVSHSALDVRQRDALGVVHHRVRNLTVALVGCGGLGSPTAEQLVRMGVAELLLVDSDDLDTPSNVRRVFGSTMADLEMSPSPAKVDVVGAHLDKLGFDTTVRRVNGDVRVEAIFRHLLDADVVINGTDTHGSRAVVNDLASSYLLPVIDIGVRAGERGDDILTGLLAEVRVLTPTTPCLWCRGTISGDVIRAENLRPDEREQLQGEGYLAGGVGQPVPSVVALTVLGSGLATCALLALLSDDAEAAPSSYWVDGFLGDAVQAESAAPVPNCWCRSRLARGDSAPPPFIA